MNGNLEDGKMLFFSSDDDFNWRPDADLTHILALTHNSIQSPIACLMHLTMQLLAGYDGHMQQVKGYLVCSWQSQEGLVPVASGINIGCGEGGAVYGLLVLPTRYNQK